MNIITLLKQNKILFRYNAFGFFVVFMYTIIQMNLIVDNE